MHANHSSSASGPSQRIPKERGNAAGRTTKTVEIVSQFAKVCNRQSNRKTSSTKSLNIGAFTGRQTRTHARTHTRTHPTCLEKSSFFHLPISLESYLAFTTALTNLTLHCLPNLHAAKSQIGLPEA